MERQLGSVTNVTLVRWLTLGLPAMILWSIGGLGAFSLLAGLSNGSVVPGVGSSAASLGVMWGSIVVCAAGGILLGMGSLFLRFKKRLLVTNVLAAFFSLFFSVLSS